MCCHPGYKVACRTGEIFCVFWATKGDKMASARREAQKRFFFSGTSPGARLAFFARELQGPRVGGGEDLYMKRSTEEARHLGTNQGFWFHLWCSSRLVIFSGALEEIGLISAGLSPSPVYQRRLLSWTDAGNQAYFVLSRIFLGSNEARGTPILVSFRCLIQIFLRASPNNKGVLRLSKVERLNYI